MKACVTALSGMLSGWGQLSPNPEPIRGGVSCPGHLRKPEVTCYHEGSCWCPRAAVTRCTASGVSVTHRAVFLYHPRDQASGVPRAARPLTILGRVLLPLPELPMLPGISDVLALWARHSMPGLVHANLSSHDRLLMRTPVTFW